MIKTLILIGIMSLFIGCGGPFILSVKDPQLYKYATVAVANSDYKCVYESNKLFLNIKKGVSYGIEDMSTKLLKTSINSFAKKDPFPEHTLGIKVSDNGLFILIYPDGNLASNDLFSCYSHNNICMKNNEGSCNNYGESMFEVKSR